MIEPGALKSLARRSNRHGLVQLAGHVATLSATGALIFFSIGSAWLVPALFAHGIVLVFLFAPLHETIHRTAFRSRWLNEVVAALCGFLLLLPPGWFRAFHFAHHRFTQDPARDPELARPKPATLGQYALYVSGLPYWWRQIAGLVARAGGRVADPFVPAPLRATVVREARIYLLLYGLVAAGSAASGSWAAVLYWIVPAILAQPFLRLYLLAEHTGCPMVPDMLANSRTVHSVAAIRRLAWNMPYHAEHHACPSVPFHALPALHKRLAGRLVHTAPGYIAVHRRLIDGLGAQS